MQLLDRGTADSQLALIGPIQDERLRAVLPEVGDRLVVSVATDQLGADRLDRQLPLLAEGEVTSA